jgi:hypothetical protein
LDNTPIVSFFLPYEGIFGKFAAYEKFCSAMDALMAKLNYKGQQRIAVINAPGKFIEYFENSLEGVRIDKEIDPRFPYEFLILFVSQVSEVESLAPIALHNLISDGILWFAYPKKGSMKIRSGIDRDHGWQILTERGLNKVRLVSLDVDWSALRFRNVRFIKSGHGRFSQ